MAEEEKREIMGRKEMEVRMLEERMEVMGREADEKDRVIEEMKEV